MGQSPWGSLGGANNVSPVDGLRYSTGLLALWLCEAKVQKRDNGFCLPLRLKESCPLALALMPDTSVPPCMPLVPLKLLPQCWSSEGVSLSKSVCGFFKRNFLDSRSFFHCFNPCWFLQPEVMGTYLPGTGTLGWGGLVWGWDSLLPRYPS